MKADPLTPKKTSRQGAWLYDLLLIGVLLVAAYFRFTGSDWGELSNQHPDENFFYSVTYDIRPVHSISEYFDADTSTLNPQNVGHGFYAYGTLPVFITRGLYDLLGQAGQIRLLGQSLPAATRDLKLFGRSMSATADLLAVALLYFIVKRLYGRKVALLASLFSAMAVMQIQQSHFYTTDNFTTFFMFLATFFAVELMMTDGASGERRPWFGDNRSLRSLENVFRNRLFWLSAAFGIALGMAVASKLNAAPLAVLLPIALFVRYFRRKQAGQECPGGRTAFEDFLIKNAAFLVAGAVFAFLSFRICQPYAFSGLWLNPKWVANIRDQRHQASPSADLPWSLQWARRTHFYSFQNLTIWGLGLPLGILAWAGFLWMGWRILRGEWKQHLLLWLWTAAYFLWQSLQYNPTMRYQLPIYPLLAMMAAWFVFRLAGWKAGTQKRVVWPPVVAAVVGVSVLLATAGWAFAFTRIYTRDEPRIAASKWIFANVPGPINLQYQTSTGESFQQPLPFLTGTTVRAGAPYQVPFVARADGVVRSVLLPYVADLETSGVQILSLSIATAPDPLPEQILANAAAVGDFMAPAGMKGVRVSMNFENPPFLKKGDTYFLRLETSGGAITLTSAVITNETDYDYQLPFNIPGYDAFGGIYTQSFVNGLPYLQVYWDDNADKLERFLSTLDQVDYIFIPTNHQYGQITRIPERYPLTTAYYRHLLGCPEDKDILWCYRVAQPGMFEGELGFDLVAVFENYPNIGSFVINDQAAEEAFTFYDHPKVMIFKKSADYDSARVQAILGAVDLSQAVHLTPGQADRYKSLMLSSSQRAIQQEGGTWSELFNREAVYNRYPGLGLALWYLLLFLLGWFAYPLLRAALPGLVDHGYPLARLTGLLLWAWLAWLAGSLGLTYSRGVIAVALGVVALAGLWLAWRQRLELKEEARQCWRYFLVVEFLFFIFFFSYLLLRIGNPDLWHPVDGGERPMEFSYFNAVLKSTIFPPYDPWFAGGYINYYYYGYVIVGTPVKFLGIVPSIAFNFILPTLFACLALGAFSLGWNLMANSQPAMWKDWGALTRQKSFWIGVAASLALVFLGNLGTVRLLYRGFMCTAAPERHMGGFSVHDCMIAPGRSPVDEANIFVRAWWTVKGLFEGLGSTFKALFQGAPGTGWPISLREWMMTPSRALPDTSGGPITEFPSFSFIWSDLHAHVIALPITVLIIAWVLSVLRSRARWKSRLDACAGFFLGGLAIGVLKPTNTWDFYTYLVLGMTGLFYALVRYADVGRYLPHLPLWQRKLALAVLAILVLAGFSLLFYQPFSHWFGSSYTSVELWKGERSNLSSYLVHWGVFLFFIVSWMGWETIRWLAETPLSALNKLRPYRDLILAGLILIVAFLVVQQIWVMSPRQNAPWRGMTILWLALPLAVWAAVLLFRPRLSEGKRLVLFMVGTSLLLTVVVEIVVLRGDVGRMNTVFKFYLEGWIMLGISAAASLGWLLPEVRKWLPRWRSAWTVIAVCLVAGAVLYPFTAAIAKVRDRMNPAAPHTLDGMTYMAYATEYDFGASLDLSEDDRAIRWMQENIQGSPVIVEANCSEYRWCSRFTIYTGLPGVLGWNWHQRQQRGVMESQVWQRVSEIDNFYTTADPDAARAFLRKYDVRYIVVGQLERAAYGEEGISKFDLYDGAFWTEIYRDGQTAIYEVNP